MNRYGAGIEIVFERILTMNRCHGTKSRIGMRSTELTRVTRRSSKKGLKRPRSMKMLSLAGNHEVW